MFSRLNGAHQGCFVRWKCLVACLFFEESQQPTSALQAQPQMHPRVTFFTHSSQTRFAVLVILIWSRCVHCALCFSYVSARAGARGERKSLLLPQPRPRASRCLIEHHPPQIPGRLVSSIWGGRESGKRLTRWRRRAHPDSSRKDEAFVIHGDTTAQPCGSRDAPAIMNTWWIW